MNDKLWDLYSTKWKALKAEAKSVLDNNNLEVKPTNPLLIFLKDEGQFASADIRVMFFGQETNDWGGELNLEENSIEERLEGYDEFFNSEYCFSYGGQFWNGISRFLKLLRNYYPEKKVRFVWNNLVKIGKEGAKGFPPDYIYKVELENFAVIKEEIEIIKPNLILFLTGPNYDGVIEDIFGTVQHEAVAPYSERQISKVPIKNVKFSFRTYHPNYLWRNDINDFFSTIIRQTNFS